MSSLRSSISQGLLAIAVTLTCLIAATQWAAAMLGYQAALGAPWIDLAGFKLYAPWKLFVWWLAFDAQAPGVFARAGAVAAFGGIAAGLVAIGGAAWRAGRKQQATTYGSARWADASDVAQGRAATASAASSSVSTGTATCATMAPSMSWRWHRRGRARASAWWCPPC